MKIATHHQPGSRAFGGNSPRRGYIVIALLVIVTLMLFYVAASSRTLYQLQRELTAWERTQVKRLAHSPPAAPPVEQAP